MCGDISYSFDLTVANMISSQVTEAASNLDPGISK